MSASDAQNMFPVDPNILVEQYRQKFSEESHRAMLLENALQNVAAERDRLTTQVEALEAQLKALTEDEGPEPAPEKGGGSEAVSGSHNAAHSPD